ncbi:MAG: PKD domain-containing protein [bacterium]|nr:PKD domain-containing protein [bacterium]
MRITPLQTFAGAALLALSTPAAAQISVCPGGGWTSGATHPAGTGSNRLLLVALGGEGFKGLNDFTAVTYGGQALTQLDEIETSAFGLAFRGELWHLAEAGVAAATSETIVVTTTGPGFLDQSVAAVTYCGVDQTTPTGNTVTTQSSGGLPIDPISTSVSVGAGNGAIAIVGCGTAGSFTWTQDLTEAADQTGSSTTLSAAEAVNFVTAGTRTAEADFAGSVNYNVLVMAELVAAPPAPAAEFVGSPLSGVEPLMVSFTDQTTGDVSSWSWTFGDGGTSTAQNPSHTYAAAGTYTVELTATGIGGSDTETKTDYITVNPVAPVAEFVGSPTSGTVPLMVDFTDQSTGVVSSWSWAFGDGGTSTAQNPSYTYAASGTYTVELTATGPGGADTETKTSYITVNAAAPVAEFVGSPTSGSAPLLVDFTDQSTGEVTSWSWTFGDGGTSTMQSPSYSYAADGTYTVELTATGPGGSDTETKTGYITVSASAPVAGFIGNPTSGTAPLMVDFTDQGTGTVTSWDWSFGDGGTSSVQNPSHSYATSGTYTVALTVTGPGGMGMETKTDYITVNAAAPTAEFAGTPTSGASPLAVDFTDMSSGDVTSWAWSFGDGGNSTAQDPSHTYTTDGVYTVSLTVTGPGGGDMETKTDYITVSSSAPVAAFSGAPLSGTAPVTTFFTDESTGMITDWLWDFGDGNTSTDQDPFHDFLFLGPQTISLTVTGPGGSDTETKVAYVVVDPAVLGTNYCTAAANTTGVPASISCTGSPAVAVNDVRVNASSMPLNEFGFFLSSPTQGFIMNPGNSSGNFCLGTGPNLGRFDNFIQNSGATGTFSIRLNLNAIPISVNPFSIALQPGDTWNFQAWFRDGQTSNFTDGTEVTFL